MKYRELSKKDAVSFWEMMNQLDHETKYMLYEPGERVRDIARVEKLIQNSVEGEDFLLVAESDDRIVGYISAQKGGLNRIAHSAYIVVGILKNYCGKGIGTEFFKRLDAWSEEKKIIISRVKSCIIGAYSARLHFIEFDRLLSERRREDELV